MRHISYWICLVSILALPLNWVDSSQDINESIDQMIRDGHEASGDLDSSESEESGDSEKPAAKYTPVRFKPLANKSTTESDIDDSDLEELADAASKMFPTASAVREEAMPHEHFKTLEHADSHGHIHTHLLHEDGKPVDSGLEIPSKQLDEVRSISEPEANGDTSLRTPFLTQKGSEAQEPNEKVQEGQNQDKLTGSETTAEDDSHVVKKELDPPPHDHDHEDSIDKHIVDNVTNEAKAGISIGKTIVSEPESVTPAPKLTTTTLHQLQKAVEAQTLNADTQSDHSTNSTKELPPKAKESVKAIKDIIKMSEKVEIGALSTINKKKVEKPQKNNAWLQSMIDRLQGKLDTLLQEILRANLESLIETSMVNEVGKSDGIRFTFDTFNLSQVHVKIDTLKVLDDTSSGSDNSSIKGDVSVELRGPVGVSFKLKYYTGPLHITEYSMHFNARLTFTHPMSKPPYVKGAQMFLLNDPIVDFKYHGPPSKAFAQKLKEILMAYTNTKMSYPNLVALPLDIQADPREVYSMDPKGILAVNVHKAVDLKAEGGIFKWMFGLSSPDTYVKSHMGSLRRSMTGVVKNDVNPVYGNETWIELPLDSVEGHEICFDLYEYSPTSDVLYGEAKLHQMDKVIGGPKTNVQDIPLKITPSKDFHGETSANASVGRLLVNMKWIPLSQDITPKPVKLAYPSQSRRLISVLAYKVTVDAGGPKLTQEQMKKGSISCSLDLKEGSVQPLGQDMIDNLEFQEDKTKAFVSAHINREFLFLDSSKDSSGSFKFELRKTLDTTLAGKLSMSLLDHVVGSGVFRVTLKDKDLETSMTLTVNVKVLYLSPARVEIRHTHEHSHEPSTGKKKPVPTTHSKKN